MSTLPATTKTPTQATETKDKAERPPVVVMYAGRKYAVSAHYADCCDSRGELVDLVKEIYGLGRYAEDWEEGEPD